MIPNSYLEAVAIGAEKAQPFPEDVDDAMCQKKRC